MLEEKRSREGKLRERLAKKRKAKEAEMQQAALSERVSCLTRAQTFRPKVGLDDTLIELALLVEEVLRDPAREPFSIEAVHAVSTQSFCIAKIHRPLDRGENARQLLPRVPKERLQRAKPYVFFLSRHLVLIS